MNHLITFSHIDLNCNFFSMKSAHENCSAQKKSLHYPEHVALKMSLRHCSVLFVQKSFNNSHFLIG